MGVYRAAFNTIAQTEPLMANKIQVPIVAMGGSKSLGSFMGPDVYKRQIWGVTCEGLLLLWMLAVVAFSLLMAAGAVGFLG